MRNLLFLSIGLDDIDSIKGGCTTHFATEIVRLIYKYGGFLLDYPRLIRFNPDIPWKTRGNGGIALDFAINRKQLKYFTGELEQKLYMYIIEESSSPASTQPSIIILDNKMLDQKAYEMLYNFSLNTLWRVVSYEELNNLLKYLKKAVIWERHELGERGLIGAFAALGYPLYYDHTYELLVYRDLYERGPRFSVDIVGKIVNLLREVEDEFSFSHIDYETKKLLITPAGPDPVIMGIRGDNPNLLYAIFKCIVKKINLKYSRWLIYVTNQGTNDHLYTSNSARKVIPYTQFKGTVSLTPELTKIPGSHVKINIKIDHHDASLYAYYESGRLKEYLTKHINYTQAYIGGCIKLERDGGLLINIEYFSPIKNSNLIKVNSVCPKCIKPMKRMGYKKGFICKECGYNILLSSDEVILSKRITSSDIYLPPLRSIKHLTKPLKRYGRERPIRIRGFRSIKYMWLNDL